MSNNSRQRRTHRTTANTPGVSHQSTTAQTSEHTDSDTETTCPDCDGSIDRTGTEHTCAECGLVVAVDDIDHGPDWRSFDDTDETVRRVGSPRSVRHHDHGLTTTMDVSSSGTDGRRRSDLYRQQRLNKQSRHQSKKSRNKERGLREITRIGSSLDLPESTVDRACQIFRDAHDEDLAPGHSIEGLCATAVHIAAREHGCPLLPTSITESTHCSQRELFTTANRIRQELDIAIPVMTVAEHVPQLVAQLDGDNAVRQHAHEVAEAASSAGHTNGRQPSGFAAGVVYAVGQMHGYQWTQDQAANAADASHRTIRTVVETLTEHDLIDPASADAEVRYEY